MSTDDKEKCPSEHQINQETFEESKDVCGEEVCGSKKKSCPRKVSFPEEDLIVTQYFEPANPWQDVPTTTRAQLAAEYLESCRRHNTPPIDTVLQQIRELPDTSIGGSTRAPRLTLSECALLGSAPVDALEAVLRKVQFRRLELEHVAIDDEGAEALFDMLEYYESATVLSISGERQFGIRGFQAASRLIKKSCQLGELEVTNHPLEPGHAPVLARALHTHSCRLRALTLQRAHVSGEPLLCLVIALKSNNSVTELRLGDNRLTASDAAQLASLLRYNSRLQLLDLSNNQIQDAGVGHISDALVDQGDHTGRSAATSPVSPHHCPLGSYESRGLSVLVLWNNQLTRNCAHHLSRALRSSHSLCVLNIGRNALGAEAVRSLQAAGALVSLGLQAARLAADAARPLADLIRADNRLQRLDLRDNRLGEPGLGQILDAMKENTTLTQIDLDDPAESSTLTAEEWNSSSIASVIREIRALCRRNEPATNERRVHRKISLTCHTACMQQGLTAAEEEKRGGRLRSPAPSPAGSPVPSAHHSRFSVTRVTPDRESSDSSSPSTPTRPTYCPTPSRFRVVQVAEPPQIQVHSAEPRRSSSRFSVTRNYDSLYNPSPTPSPPPSTPSPCPSPVAKPKPSDVAVKTSDLDNSYNSKDNVAPISDSECNNTKKELSDIVKEPTNCDNKHNTNHDKCYQDKTEQLSHCEVLHDNVITTETKLVTNTTEVSEKDKVDVKVEVTVKTESFKEDKCEYKNIDEVTISEKKDDVIISEKKDDVIISEKKEGAAMRQIEAITENLGNLIQEMKELSTKTVKRDVKNDCTQTDVDVNKLDTFNNVPVINSVVLKKNKSESSLDSPDLEVSRLMNKKLVGSPFCDSSSSLEISGSSMESLNALETKPIIIQSVESDTELDRRKTDHVTLSTESSIESNTSEATPVNSGNFLNMSVSSNDSVSPLFEKSKKLGSLSSLEASVSSLESKHEKVMVTSADSGIEYSLQNPTENKEDNSSNEGTLTNNSSLKETVKKDPCQLQDTLTSSPKRTSSLLDVPALKTKGLDRMRKISWVAPSPSFHIPRPEPEKVEIKLPSHLDKLLSLFQHPTSLFSRNTNEDEKKSASNTPPRKDSSLTSSFWSWGSVTEKEKDDKLEDRDSSEATDSTLSERIQVSFVDESFSKKLDSKTPSTDTENTLSEFQSYPIQNSETSDASQTDKTDRVTESTTDDNLVQKSLVLSVKCMDNAGSNGNAGAGNVTDLSEPNDLNKNYEATSGDSNKNEPLTDTENEMKDEQKPVEIMRPRSFAAVLKSSGSENSLDKQPSPDSGQPVDKLPSKVIRGIKENISPENTLTSSMTNTKTLAMELSGRQAKNQPIMNAVWELTAPLLESIEGKAPIATIEETCDESADQTVQLDYIDDIKFIDEKNMSADSGVTSLEGTSDDKKYDTKITTTSDLEHVDLGKDALSYLIYENQDYEPDTEHSEAKVKAQEGSLADELKEAEIKEKQLDLSPELVIDEAIEVPEVFVAKEAIGLRTSPVIPERAKIKKSNSLEDVTMQEKNSPKIKTIAFKIPETSPRDIPQRRPKLRSRSGSSPKSLPESLNKPCPLSKLDSISKKKKKVSSLGKMARDSLLALNMTEEEISEFRRSYKLTSVESLRSLESVSEDANSQSGTSIDSRCRSCLRTSQESLMSLDSISEDCRCGDASDKEKPGRSVR